MIYTPKSNLHKNMFQFQSIYLTTPYKSTLTNRYMQHNFKYISFEFECINMLLVKQPLTYLDIKSITTKYHSFWCWSGVALSGVESLLLSWSFTARCSLQRLLCHHWCTQSAYSENHHVYLFVYIFMQSIIHAFIDLHFAKK